MRWHECQSTTRGRVLGRLPDTLTWCILSRNGIPNVPNTSLWKCATVTSISFSLSMSTWSKGISWGHRRRHTELSDTVGADECRICF